MRALFRELTSSSVEDELAAEAGGQALGRQGFNQIADSEIERTGRILKLFQR